MDPRVRFTLCSQGRTGSNMLRTMLDSHSMIRCFGEIFLFDATGTADQKQRNISFSECKNQSEVLRTAWLRSDGKPVVGFTLHDNWKKVRSTLQLNTYLHRELIPLLDVRLIWLERKDKLAQFVSEEVAKRTGVWNTQDPSRRPTVSPIHIDPHAADVWIRRTLGDRKSFRLMLKDHESISVTYEDLRDDLENTKNAVMDFLGVEREDLKPKTCRVSTYRHVSELVKNYDQIKMVFDGVISQVS